MVRKKPVVADVNSDIVAHPAHRPEQQPYRRERQTVKLQKTSEHGPTTVVRADETPYKVYQDQEAILNKITQLAERRRTDAELINRLAAAARQKGTSWRRIAEAAGMPFKTVYDRVQADRPIVPPT